MNSNSPNLRKHNIRNCVVRLCVFRNYTSIFVIVGSVGMRLGLLWGISFDAATSNRIMTRNSSSPFLPFNSPYFLGRRSALTTGGGGGARRADRLQKQSIFGSSFAFSLSFSLSLSLSFSLSLSTGRLYKHYGFSFYTQTTMIFETPRTLRSFGSQLLLCISLPKGWMSGLCPSPSLARSNVGQTEQSPAAWAKNSAWGSESHPQLDPSGN
jgi:hypothetical protein